MTLIPQCPMMSYIPGTLELIRFVLGFSLKSFVSCVDIYIYIYIYLRWTAREEDMYDPRNENSLIREVFAADQSIQGYIPDIRRDKKGWFKYFDHNNDSKLSKPELLQALIDTLMTISDGEEAATTTTSDTKDDNGYHEQANAPDIDALSDMLNALWGLAGLDSEDLLPLDQFLVRDGIGDSIIGSLPPLPTRNQGYPDPVPVQTVPAMQYLHMQCGHCGAQKPIAYTPTVVATNMIVNCSACGCRNDITLPRINSDSFLPHPPSSMSPLLYPPDPPPIPTTAQVTNNDTCEGSTRQQPLSFPAQAQRIYKHVFVLSPGRCGSQTFATSCQHITNYSTGDLLLVYACCIFMILPNPTYMHVHYIYINSYIGHETNANKYGNARFDYNEMHIECDNRLSWLLGNA